MGFTASREVFDSFLPFIDLERGVAKEPLKLDRMRALCAAAGDPQASFKSIHIAGSKGKGSVAAMCASILREAGFRAGLYVSPHVVEYRERITLSGEYFTEEAYAACGEEVHAAIESCRRADPAFAPSFFELLTLLAFLVFRREACPWAVLETGLGGRLDSTNVVIPEASIITPIEIEHAEYLGSTIREIAREKAGIIKAGRPVIVSRMDAGAAEVMRARAAELGSEFMDSGVLTRIRAAEPCRAGTSIALSVEPRPGERMDIEALLPLVGKVQAENASVAALAMAKVLPALDARGISSGLSKARIPARFEILPGDPLLVVDGSHTPASVAWALDSWRSVHGEGGILLFACAADKDSSAMAAVLAPSFDRIIVTKPGGFKRSDPLSAFASFSRYGKPVIMYEEPLAALEAARASGSAILATGSFYLAAIIREAALRAS